MPDNQISVLIDQLDNLLDLERSALLDGALDQLGLIMAQKDRLIAEINALEGAERASLAALQEKAARNQVLLNSAMEGIRAVANRMADLRRVRRGLETYDRQGRKETVGATIQSSVEKRA